jgi:uncharacterized membrane protein YhaH (DUF805 family)
MIVGDALSGSLAVVVLALALCTKRLRDIARADNAAAQAHFASIEHC